MNRRRLLVLLVILGLLGGGIVHVPVALGATYEFSGAAYGNVNYISHTMVQFVANITGVVWSTYYQTNPSEWAYSNGAMSGTCTVDGYTLPHRFEGANDTDATFGFLYYDSGGYNWVVVNCFAQISYFPSGSHTIAWNRTGSVGAKTVLWVGSVAGYDIGVYGYGFPGGGTYGPGVWPVAGQPLSVTIDSGPTAVDLVDGGSWHATAVGGSGTGYTYAWDYGPIGPFFAYPIAGQTFTHIFPAGNWTISVRATDSLGATAYDDIVVTAATIAGAYQAHLTRSGPLGQYMSITVTDAAGAPVTISSTSGTQYGLYEAGGAFGWYAADSEAAQLEGGSYVWRWTMSYTITPPGLAIKPPPDFWFQSSVHLAIPNLNLLVMHHFTGVSDIVDPWFPPGPPGSDVGPVIPETPPSPTSTLPDWLAPLWDFFVKIFRFLFVPSSTDFSAQLASGWILIASPVPSITPQYTIPFPNPNHLLAPTGDSVNIDFSVVQGYAGYSIMHTIVQVLMYAILVFIVIGIIT